MDCVPPIPPANQNELRFATRPRPLRFGWGFNLRSGFENSDGKTLFIPKKMDLNLSCFPFSPYRLFYPPGPGGFRLLRFDWGFNPRSGFEMSEGKTLLYRRIVDLSSPAPPSLLSPVLPRGFRPFRFDWGFKPHSGFENSGLKTGFENSEGKTLLYRGIGDLNSPGLLSPFLLLSQGFVLLEKPLISV